MRERDRRRDPFAATEGLDDELLRDAIRLVTDDPPVRRAGREPARPASARVRLSVAKLAYEVGLLPRALEQAEAVRALAPGHPSALRLIAAIQHRRGRVSDAIALHERLARAADQHGSALRLLGHAFERSLRREAAATEAPPTWASPALIAALPELEHSFGLALGQDLSGALRVVDRMAVRARGKEPELLKVAAIQRAWLLEQAHDVTGAIATLEQLADEPGLTHDVERLLCLSVLYEREGTAERIRRAVRAVRYAYVATGQHALLRRIARLLRKLGHASVAELVEERYLALFRAEMQVPSAREIAAGAAASYVPHERLRRLGERADFAPAMHRLLQRGRAVHRRRAAVLALAIGDAELARDVLRALEARDEATGVDVLYLADAEEALGDAERARTLRRRGLPRVQHPDGTTIVAALAKLEPEPSGGDHAHAVHRLLGGRDGLERALQALRTHAALDGQSAGALHALALVEEALGLPQAREHRARASALAARPHERAARVLAAAAYRAHGHVRGVLHEIWVEPRGVPRGEGGGFEPGDVLGAVAPDLRAQAVNLFYAVKSFARARHPHRLVDLDARRFVLKLTKEDEPSSGDSAGLPIAVAFLAALLGLEPPADVAYSGAVVCDAHDVLLVRRVGDVEPKIEGAYERRVRRIVLPAENREDVELAERIAPAVVAEIVRYARDFDALAAELFPELG